MAQAVTVQVDSAPKFLVSTFIAVCLAQSQTGCILMVSEIYEASSVSILVTKCLDFYDQTRIPGWINLAGLFVCVLLLLCFVILPPTATRRHYLNVCLLIGIIFLELGFIIPWAQKPDQCFDEITPNDMYSNITCAFSGALIVAGGTSTAMWVVMRTLSTHLQVCWNITPGPSFFLFSQTVGWGVSGILLATELSLSGVSFRFGDYCHVNQDASLASLWGPLLGLAGLSLILQVST